MNARYDLIYAICVLVTLFHVPVVANDLRDKDLTVSIAAESYGKMPLMLSILGQAVQDIVMLVDLVRHDLAWSGQFDVAVERAGTVPTKNELGSYALRGFPLVLFIQREPDGKSFVWRLYDTTQALMLKGKRLTKKGLDARIWAHELADTLWPILTGQEGIFSAKVAYCKEVAGKCRRPYKYLCVADYDGSNEVVMVPTVVVAPRWGRNGLLFYSECTNANIRLKYLDVYGKPHLVSNFDGLNMLPSFSHDGSISVYCASRGNGSAQLYYCAPGIFKRLTHNEGNNVSPSLTADGTKVYFCSDYVHGKPAIYCMDIGSGNIREVIGSGLCPNYSDKVNRIVYIRNVRGVGQIFVYDCSSGVSEQLTFDNLSKDECSFSPCGNYVIYATGRPPKSRIAMINVWSRQRYWITPADVVCTYPAISEVCAVGQRVSCGALAV
jgi:TolB protein